MRDSDAAADTDLDCKPNAHTHSHGDGSTHRCDLDRARTTLIYTFRCTDCGATHQHTYGPGDHADRDANTRG